MIHCYHFCPNLLQGALLLLLALFEKLIISLIFYKVEAANIVLAIAHVLIPISAAIALFYTEENSKTSLSTNEADKLKKENLRL